MNYKNQPIMAYVLILSLALLGGSIQAQDGQISIQEKMEHTKKNLKQNRTRELLFAFKDTLAKTALSSESKERKLRLYSEASSFLRSMMDENYDPNYMAPTSTPLPDPSLSSGSDPSQISDPVKRQQAIDERNALAAKIEKHNFQRDLRKELASVALRAKAEVGATGDDAPTVVQHKLEAAGLTRDEASSIVGDAVVGSGNEEK